MVYKTQSIAVIVRSCGDQSAIHVFLEGFDSEKPSNRKLLVDHLRRSLASTVIVEERMFQGYEILIWDKVGGDRSSPRFRWATPGCTAAVLIEVARHVRLQHSDKNSLVLLQTPSQYFQLDHTNLDYPELYPVASLNLMNTNRLSPHPKGKLVSNAQTRVQRLKREINKYYFRSTDTPLCKMPIPTLRNMTKHFLIKNLGRQTFLSIEGLPSEFSEEPAPLWIPVVLECKINPKLS